jgi:hypothetical protein
VTGNWLIVLFSLIHSSTNKESLLPLSLALCLKLLCVNPFSNLAPSFSSRAIVRQLRGGSRDLSRIPYY